MIYIGRLNIACMTDVAIMTGDFTEREAAIRYFSRMLSQLIETVARVQGIWPFGDGHPDKAAWGRLCEQIYDFLACPSCGARGLNVRVEATPFSTGDELCEHLSEVLVREERVCPGYSPIPRMAPDGEIQIFRRPPVEKAREN